MASIPQKSPSVNIPPVRNPLKVCPEIFAAALQAGQDRAFRFWTIARAVDHLGSGRLAVATLQGELDRRGVRGGAPGTVRRILKAGGGVFWTVYRNPRGDKIIHLCGAAEVAASLGVARLRLPHPAVIPWALVLTLADFRAACFAARFARNGEGDGAWSRPISRAALAHTTGVSVRRQQRWHRALEGRLQSAQNVEPLRLDRGRPTPRKLEDGETVHVGAVGRDLAAGHFVGRVDAGGYRFYIVFERLPNSYRTDRRSIAPAPRGRTSKINGKLASRQNAAGKHKRVYYDPQDGPEVKATAKAMQALTGREAIYTRAALLPALGWRRSVIGRGGQGLRLWTRHDGVRFYG